jgi:quinol monooxygenase YgiN
VVTEMAIFTALPGKEDELGRAIGHGVEFIRQYPGCISVGIARSIEKPARFTVSIDWQSVDVHVNGFRNSPLFGQWIGSIMGLFDQEKLDTQHYQAYRA